jgi:hypothetical protein
MAAMQLKTTSVLQAYGDIFADADDDGGNEDEFEDGGLKYSDGNFLSSLPLPQFLF